jgi:hypothetical protein
MRREQCKNAPNKRTQLTGKSIYRSTEEDGCAVSTQENYFAKRIKILQLVALKK